MAKSRKQGGTGELLLELFVNTPWWVPLITAALTFGVVLAAWYEFMVRILHSRLVPSEGVFAAGISATVILFLGLMAQFTKRSRGRLLATNTSIEAIRQLSWQDFERLVAAAYARDFFVEQKGGSAPDGGVDIRLTRGNETILIQCKKWKAKQVGVPVVREMYGVMIHEQATRMVIITSGTFTAEARSFAKGKPIDLIDGVNLVEMLATVRKESLNPTDLYTDSTNFAPVPAGSSNSETRPLPLAPECPRCGAAMEERRARRGAQAGKVFWGCTTFPRCRGNVNI